VARDAVQLDDALLTASRYADEILVEHVVPGREIGVAVLREADGSRWAPLPLEIHARGLFDTATKYNARLTVPARLDGTDPARLTQTALALFDARLRRSRTHGLLPHRQRSNPQRGQHDARYDS
jgi:D-alanine-D-alanine ligase